MNSNGTFSVGKTWKLNELRAVEVVTVSYASILLPYPVLTRKQPSSFNITLARTYMWQTEQANEQLEFLHLLVDLFFQSVSDGTLRIIGLQEPRTQSGETDRFA
jgi:hypothetical protein